ncbi:MAG: tetraacyldisaccharide 4'-kinase [Desulfovibrionaceae bacterium]|nr:tetraacyldisaccharide 4'-kinase [Desulfovibrionaceae bacterium]
MTPHSLYETLGPLLKPFGLPYAGVMSVRRILYAGGRLPSYRPACPVVSVGNIAWGGSGKTPLTAWLLAFARTESLKAAVLSRGYKARPGTAPLHVRPGVPAQAAGDEPLMLAHAFPEAEIVTFPNRAEAARYAEACFNPDLILLDDGMQHLAVRRDINIVLLRPEDLEADWDRVIPTGPWREGLSALASASAFVLKAEAEELTRLEGLAWQRLENFDRPLFSFRMAPTGLRPLFSPEQGKNLDPEEYRDRPYALISGVGNPAGVETTAARLLGRPPVRHFDFADHHPYSETDVQAVRRMLPAPLPVVCTAKDAVKLASFREAWDSAPVWVLETEAEFGPSVFTDESFSSWFTRSLREVVTAKSMLSGGHPSWRKS